MIYDFLSSLLPDGCDDQTRLILRDNEKEKKEVESQEANTNLMITIVGDEGKEETVTIADHPVEEGTSCLLVCLFLRKEEPAFFSYSTGDSLMKIKSNNCDEISMHILRDNLLISRKEIIDAKEFSKNKIILKFKEGERLKMLHYKTFEMQDKNLEDSLQDLKQKASQKLLRNLIWTRSKGTDIFCLDFIQLIDDHSEIDDLKLLDLYQSVKDDIDDLKLRTLMEASSNFDGNMIQKSKVVNFLKRTSPHSSLFKNSVGPLDIIMVTPEYRGVAMVGGVGSMVADLSEQLVCLNESVIVIMPLFPQTSIGGLKFVKEIEVLVDQELVSVDIFSGTLNGVTLLLYSNPEVFDAVYPFSVVFSK